MAPSDTEQQPSQAGAKAKKQRNLRVKKAVDEEPEQPSTSGAAADGADDGVQPEVARDKLEQMKLLQKIRKRAGGTSADHLARIAAEEGPEDLDTELEVGRASELMGTFSKAKSGVTKEEDPNMEKFIEQELARRLGKRAGSVEAEEDAEAKRRRQEAEMYQIPDEYKTVLAGDTVVPGMTTVMTEVPLAAAVKLRNIEEVENMKKRMLGAVATSMDNKGGGPQRKQFVASFGKQKAKLNLDRDAAEQQHHRMKYVSERRPAVPTHRLADK